MNRKAVKLISISLVVVMLVLGLSSIVSASSGTFRDIDTNYFSGGDTTDTSQTIGAMISAIINVAQVIGVGVAIIMLIVLAIKYISAAPSDKAEIKKHAVVYVVGAIVLFAATGILQLVKQFAGIVNDNVTSK